MLAAVVAGRIGETFANFDVCEVDLPPHWSRAAHMTRYARGGY
jgi:hypothetical protein